MLVQLENGDNITHQMQVICRDPDDALADAPPSK